MGVSRYKILIGVVLLIIFCDSTWAKSPGFTLNTGLSLSFDQSYYSVGSTAFATVEINGNVEPNSYGDVCISGNGTDTYTSLDTSTTSMVNIPMPLTPGEYTYNASLNVHTDENDANNHTTHTQLYSNTVIITVFSLSINSSSFSIAAGGKSSGVHKTTISATVTPSDLASSIIISLPVGTGHDIEASLGDLSLDTETGTVSRELTSSDKVETVVLTADLYGYTTSTSVAFITGMATFTINNPVLLSDGNSTSIITMNYKLGENNIDQHYIKWGIKQIYNNNGDLIYDVAGPLDDRNGNNFGSIALDKVIVITTSNGISSTVFIAGTVSGTIIIEAEDTSVYL